MTSRYLVREQENPTRFAELKAAIERAGGAVASDVIHVEEWWTVDDDLDEHGQPVFTYHYGLRGVPIGTLVNLTITKKDGCDGG